MKKIILMANDSTGLEICKYLVENNEQIVRLYVHEHNKAKKIEEIIAASRCPENKIFPAKMLKDESHVEGMYKLRADWIITVYWAYIISQSVINAASEGTVNFHPALLPVNRGWYPHVHSLIDGSPLGVTLHSIDATADTGPIWVQKETELSPFDTADTIYYRQQEEIVELFKQNWHSISNNKINPMVQEESKAVYHRKSEVDEIDELDLEATMKVRDVINLLRARSFDDRGFAYYYDEGEKVHLNLRLGPNTDFSGPDRGY